MDEIDLAIADELKAEGRATSRAIATKLGLSARNVSTRIDAMFANQELRVAAVADIFAAGNDLMLAIGVTVSGRPALDVARELSAFPDVCAVNVVSGEADLEILVLSRDHETLREFVSTQLAQVEGVSRLAPALTLEVFKFTTEWAPFP